MRKILFRSSFLVIILAVFVYYISKNIGTIEQTVKVTLSQSLGFISLAFLCAVAAFLLLTTMHQKIFKMLGIQRSKTEMFLLQTQSMAVNAIVPSGGVSVGLLFANDAKQRNESGAAAVTAVILTLLTDYASIALLLIIAMVYLYSVGSLGIQVVIPSVAFLIITIGLYVIIYYAGKNRHALKRFMIWSKSLLNKLLKVFKKEITSDNTGMDQFIDELANAHRIMREERKQLYQAFGIVLASHFMYLATLYILFFSLGFDPLYRVMIAGYAVGMMFVVISPTPNGVGFVEGSMALVYTSLGISGAAAATVTLIYRGFSFWLPLFIGFVALQRKHLLGIFGNKA